MTEQVREVRLLKKHTHAGRRMAPGESLTLPVRVAKWLVDQGSAEFVGVAVAAEVKTRVAGAPVRRASCCGGRW